MNMNALESFIESGYKNAMSYEEFRTLIHDLLAKGMVTGNDQSADLIPYTEMNNQRMNRLEKHYQVGDNLKARLSTLKNNYTFLTITEGWCGDSAQIVPVIEKMASASEHIRSFYILRDDNPEIMDLLLTNGARSIPITICVKDDTKEMVWKYGPRPAAGFAIVNKAKAEGKTKEQMSEELHLWYGRNKQADIEAELQLCIDKMV